MRKFEILFGAVYVAFSVMCLAHAVIHYSFSSLLFALFCAGFAFVYLIPADSTCATDGKR